MNIVSFALSANIWLKSRTSVVWSHGDGVWVDGENGIGQSRGGEGAKQPTHNIRHCSKYFHLLYDWEEGITEYPALVSKVSVRSNINNSSSSKENDD